MARTRSPRAPRRAKLGEPSLSPLHIAGTAIVIPATRLGTLNLDGLNEHQDATVLYDPWEGVFSAHVGYTELGLLFRLVSM